MTDAEKLIKIAENEKKVYEAGKQAEREEFWNDSFDKDAPNGFLPYFFAGMTADNFEKFIYPNDKIKPLGATGAEGMFAYFNRNYRLTSNPAPPIDMTEFCSHADFSTCTSATNVFLNARCKNLILDLSSCESLNYTFSGSNGGYIDNITLKVTSKAKSYTNTFYYAIFLTQITFTEDSEIAANISFAHSPLNKASIESVVAALSPTVTGKTATFKKTAKEAAFTADEWAALIATKSNWTFLLV